MEMMILIALCLTTLLAILLLKQILGRRTTTTKLLNLPPSPWRLPVIGNLHQLSLHPHRSFYSLSLRYGPLMLLHFGRVPILVVSSADVAQHVLKTHDLKFANRPTTKALQILLNGGREVAFSSYGEYWRQMKSLLTVHLLGKKMVKSFARVREEEIKATMEKLEEASSSSLPINLSELLHNTTKNVVCRTSMGKQDEENTRDFKSQLRKISELLSAFPVGDYIPGLAWIDKIRRLDRKMEEASKSFVEFLERVVQEHVDKGDQNKETSDFVDILLRIQRDKTLGLIEIHRSDIRVIILDIMLAGTSTNFATMDWAMTLLIRHPESMKKVQDEIRRYSRHNKSYVSEEEIENMKYLKAVIKEVLRLHPPGPLLLPRQLSEDVKLNGYDIAAGTQVFINAWAIQRDTATWGPDAEEFKPERHLDLPSDYSGQIFNFIPFGSGRRICPGIGFGLALTEVVLANLVNRFNWRVQTRPRGDDDEYDLAEATGFEVCRKFPIIAFPSSN